MLTPSLANDTTTLVYTTGAYAGTSSTPLVPYSAGGTVGSVAATYATGWAGANHNGPYTSTNLCQNNYSTLSTSNVVQGRIVSAGARIQYTGETLYESGVYSCFHEPTHACVSGFTPQGLYNYADVDVRAVTREPCMTTVFAISQEEQEFFRYDNSLIGGGTSQPNSLVAAAYPFCQGSATWNANPNNSTTSFMPVGGAGSNFFIGAPVAVIVVTGTPGRALHLEYIQHMEYTGNIAGPMLTPVTADIEGAEKVISAALTVPAAKLANPKASTWSHMFNALKAAARVAAPILVPAAEAAVAVLLA